MALESTWMLVEKHITISVHDLSNHCHWEETISKYALMSDWGTILKKRTVFRDVYALESFVSQLVSLGCVPYTGWYMLKDHDFNRVIHGTKDDH